MSGQDPELSRRDMLKLLSLGAGAWILAACSQVKGLQSLVTLTPKELYQLTGDLVTSTAGTTPAPILKGDLLPTGFEAGRITPIEDFFVQSYAGIAKPNPESWQLDISGLVANPLQIDLTELRMRPARQIMVTLECIGNPVGGGLIGNAMWAGVPLADILHDAGILPEARHILFHCEDGYRTSVEVDVALHERSTLAFMMNGQELPVAHGYPVRVIFPGVYGQKQPKWVVSIRVSATDSLGTWEEKGWSNQAEIQVNSRIETPKIQQKIPSGYPFYITGMAMAATSGVQKVEVSVDDGLSWQEATLLSGSHTGVWTLWYWVWNDPRPGEYVLVAKATDGNGKTQETSREQGFSGNVFPNGTSYAHRVRVQVV
ncbi:MAG: molybdopterin-dependent oxidoreductase [Chloroflexota bacterium]